MRCCCHHENPPQEDTPTLSTIRRSTIRTYLSEKVILPSLKNDQRDTVIQEMLTHLKELGALNDVTLATKNILDREAQMSTSIGDAIACPHARTTAVDKLTTIIGISKHPILFDDTANGACKIIILTLMPPTINSPYMAFITAMLTLLNSPTRRHQILNAQTARAVRKALLS
ncbi:MAG: PTS sugar transporter subunit IIA [bacterium]|nr:PTS sugar transporter subunit IIA [bacterium]